MPQPELPFTSRPAPGRQSVPAGAWWGPVWRGLVADPGASHYLRMRSAVWLFLYFVVHADRRTGALHRRAATVAREMGVSERTVRHWLAVLRRHGYVTTRSTGRALRISVAKWRPLGKGRPPAGPGL
jgi:hypothetical protein